MHIIDLLLLGLLLAPCALGSVFRDTKDVTIGNYGSLNRTIALHQAAINSLDMSVDNQQVMATSSDRTVLFVDAATGESLNAYEVSSWPAYRTKMTLDERRILVAEKNALRLFNIESMKEVDQAGLASIVGVEIVSAGSYAVVAAGKRIYRIPVFRGTLRGQVIFQSAEPLKRMVRVTDTLVAIATAKRISIVDTTKAADARLVIPHTRANIACLTMARDEVTMFVGGDDGRVRQFDLTSGELVHEFFAGADGDATWDARVTAMRLSFNGQLLVTGHQDGTVRVFDLRQGGVPVLVTYFKGHYLRITGIELSDSEMGFIYTSSEDARMQVWAFGHPLAKLSAVEREDEAEEILARGEMQERYLSTQRQFDDVVMRDILDSRVTEL